ncbi:MAG: polysaccharide pyruvyl transferase family protein [Oscillospiraceae bacterium]|nr:polysaccharide pyruvyl transferase family protein [Oscillospiraceae bacterium]
MDKTIRQVTHDQCTGCGACYNKCPVDAIEMKPDKEGFFFPQIDNEKCIDCGLCLKTCPVAQPKYENLEYPGCYAVMASDEVRANSSSGGVFTIMAEWMLEKGGVVCGAAYTDDYYAVENIVVTDREQLHKLRGSKYVQSDAKLIYRQVKEYLDAGTPVLFTGTPCQVAAMNSYLGKPHELLYTMDLVCHGVPSPAVYEKFVKEQEALHGSKAVRVSFRDKDIVKWDVSTAIDFEDGQKYRKKRNECAYMKSFLKLLTLRKSCGQCPFAKMPRQGDMTIADFWDIDKYNPKYDDRKGTSMVLQNNTKGQEMLEVLWKRAKFCKTAPLDHAVKHNAQLKYSSLLHPRRERFYDLLDTYQYGFEKAVDYGMNRKFDIGYIGWWYGANYGSVMTNYALNRVLKDMGKSVLMLEWPVLSGEVPKGKPDNKTRRFAKHFYEQSMSNRIEDYGRFNYHCETFVVGSDQLWNWWSNRDVGSYHFFLDFVDDGHKKIAYSTSFGHDSAYYPEEMRMKVSYLLQRFDAISVRETGGVRVCQRDFGVDAVQTVDPVFLCRMEDYDAAAALSDRAIDGEYVLGYILNPTEEKINAVRLTAEKMNLPYHIILDGQDDFAKLKEQANDPNVLENVEVSDWVKYFKHASYVVTDSFHGYCYSVIFGHSMTVFPNRLRGLSRFESLSKMTGTEDRLFYSGSEMAEAQPWTKPVDFAQVKEKMQPLIDFSVQWLKDALQMEKTPPKTKALELRSIMQLQEQCRNLEEQNRQLNEQLQQLSQTVEDLIKEAKNKEPQRSVPKKLFSR